MIFCDQLLQHLLRRIIVFLSLCRVDNDGIKHFSGLIDNCQLASVCKSRIPAKYNLSGDWRLHQKLMEVLAEYADGALLCLLRQFIPYFTLDGRRDQTVITVCNCLIEIACTIMLHISDNLLYKPE